MSSYYDRMSLHFPENYWVLDEFEADGEIYRPIEYGYYYIGTAKDNCQDMLDHEREYVREVYCYELDMYFRSTKAAAEYIGATKPGIVHSCKSPGTTCRGYHFCYPEDKEKFLRGKSYLKQGNYKPIIAISPDGKRFKFHSRREAADYIGIPNCGISATLHGYTPHTHGWTFEEADYYD